MPGTGKFTPKEDRMAKHVAESEEAEGMPMDKAKAVGFATMNKAKHKPSLAARAQMMRKGKKG